MLLRSWGHLWVQGGQRERGWETALGWELVGPHGRRGDGIVMVVLAERMPAVSWVRIWLWPSGLEGMVALLVPQVLVVMNLEGSLGMVVWEVAVLVRNGMVQRVRRLW